MAVVSNNVTEKTKHTKSRTRSASCKIAAQAKAEGANVIQAQVQEQTKRKRGQPTKFSRELWERILEAVAMYGDLIQICNEPDMPAVSTVRRWYREDPKLKDEMREAWEEATYLGHSVNMNILRGGVMSTGDFRRDEAIVANNRWFMGKTNRRDFGDKTSVDLNSTINISIPQWANALPKPNEVIDGETLDPDAVFERTTVERITGGMLSETPNERQDDSKDNAQHT